MEGQGRLGRPKSGKGAHRSLGESGGEAPRRQEEPVGGFGWSRDGRWWLVGVTVAAAEGWLSGGGAPATDWRGERAGELERLLAHQKVPEVGVGVARSGLSAAARARRRRVMAVGGGPVRGSGRGGAEETQGTKGVRFKGLIGEVEVRGGGSTATGEERRR